MGSATSKAGCSPRDFLCSCQFLAAPSLSLGCFLAATVCLSGCQAAKSSRWAQGSSRQDCTG